MDDDSDSEYLEYVSLEAKTLEAAIISNDIKTLKSLLKNTNVNVPLNNRQETALILAVKLSHIEMVDTLLNTPDCDKNYVNINDCSPVDLALVTAFDNRLEPRHSICWRIVALLLEHEAHPVCKDAMMYVIRTALKCEDSDFIFRVINTCIAQATSIPFHELLLQKIHRHQPMCAGIIDPFLERVAHFTIKLLKIVNGHNLKFIINSFEYYAESHWACRTTKAAVFGKLIVYSTAAGWNYTKADICVVRRICTKTAMWCRRSKQRPSSLLHQSRVAFRRSLNYSVDDALESVYLPQTIKNYILLADVDSFYDVFPSEFDVFCF